MAKSLAGGISHLTKAVQEYEGITYFNVGGIQIKDFQALPTHNDLPSRESDLVELSRRKPNVYIALAANKSNPLKTEEFLKSKVKKGESVHHWMDAGTITGWYNLVLDDAALKEVQDHEGIEDVKVEGKLQSFEHPIDTPGKVENKREKSQDLGKLSFEENPSLRTERSRLEARDVQLYHARATKDSDVQKTEEFLKSKIQSGTIILQHVNKGVVSGWYNLALDPEAKNAVEEYKGIEHVDLMEEWERYEALSTTDGSPGETEHTELVRRDVEIYAALATNTSDTQDTEEFLKSKVQTGHIIFQIKRDNEVKGWYNLVLDAAAYKEVQAHEGIEAIKVDGKLEPFRALPGNNCFPMPCKASRTFGKKRVLSSRDLRWEKQAKADKALVMDSQYS
jgi:hypothetical protein